MSVLACILMTRMVDEKYPFASMQQHSIQLGPALTYTSLSAAVVASFQWVGTGAN